MLFCEDCRINKGWPDSLVWPRTKCEVCGATGECYDVPAVMLIPEDKLSLEQKGIRRMLLAGFQEKAEQMVITYLDGRVDNRMTDLLKQVFIKRNNEIDWYATYAARLKVQDGHRESQRARRDRRNHEL
jgi:hypothetical protein